MNEILTILIFLIGLCAIFCIEIQEDATPNENSSTMVQLQCQFEIRSFHLQNSYYKNLIKLRTNNNIPFATLFIELEEALDDDAIRRKMMNIVGSQYSIQYEGSINYIIQEYRRYYNEIYPILPINNITDNFIVVDCWNSSSIVMKEVSQPTDNSIDFTSRDPMDYFTVVSGYWSIRNKYNLENTDNFTFSPYREWFLKSLRIHMPYIIFTDEFSIQPLLEPRLNLPTLYIFRNLSSFTCYPSYQDDWIHPIHVPSKELGIIWLEKMKMLTIASQLSNKPFFIWIDAGLSRYRNLSLPSFPWSVDTFYTLPKDRVSYVHVQEPYHSFSGGTIIIPRRLIPLMDHLFYQEYQRMVQELHDWQCGSDQLIWTRIRAKYPELFHAMSYDYGDIDFLWGRQGQRYFENVYETL